MAKPQYKIECRTRTHFSGRDWGVWQVVARHTSAQARDQTLAKFTKADTEYVKRTGCQPWREYRSVDPQ